MKSSRREIAITLAILNQAASKDGVTLTHEQAETVREVLKRADGQRATIGHIQKAKNASAEQIGHLVLKIATMKKNFTQVHGERDLLIGEIGLERWHEMLLERGIRIHAHNDSDSK